MVICSQCGKNIDNGYFCEDCQKFYCGDHSNCHICGKPSDFIITTEVYLNGEVNWITSQNNLLGLSGFELYIPFDFIKLFKNISDKEIKIIIFDSKLNSNNYKGHLVEKYNLYELDNTVYSEKSRYTIFEIPNINESYILINNNAVRSVEEINFLISFLSKCIKKIQKYNESDFIFVDDNFYLIFYEYYKKFIPESEIISMEMIESKAIIKRKILSSYIEIKSLKECIVNTNINFIYRFLIERINILFSLYDLKQLTSFISTMSFLGSIVEIKYILNEFSDYVFFNELDNLVIYNIEKIKKELKDYDDLIKIIDILLENNVYIKNINEYQKYIITSIKNIIEIIEPKYASITIMDIVRGICDNFMNNLFYLDHNNFYEIYYILNRIILNEKYNILIRIMSAKNLLHCMRESCRINFDDNIYKLMINTTYYYVDLFIKNYDIFENIDIEGFKIGYNDAIDDLFAVYSLSEAINDVENKEKILNDLTDYVEKYDIKSHKIIVYWKKYLLNHDYNFIKYIYKTYESIEYDNVEYLEGSLKVIAFLSCAMIEKNNYKKYINKAYDYCYDLIVDMNNDLLNRSYRNYNIYNNLISIFEILLQNVDKCELKEINQVNKHLASLENDLNENDPIFTIIYKTKLLISMLNKEIDKLKYEIKIVDEYTNIYLIDFLDRIKKWLNSYEGRTFINLEIITYDRDLDLWEEIFVNNVTELMLDEIKDNIIDSDFILYVEGMIDKVILEKFRTKIAPDKKILILSSEGYTNESYLKVQNEHLKKFKIPIYYVFDGDTLNDKIMYKNRQKIEGLLNIKNENSITLSKNSIEDYILNKNAIKKVFTNMRSEEISNIINKNINKRNKKDVLRHICRLNNTSYGIEVASNIAVNMEKEDIDKEIIDLFLL